MRNKFKLVPINTPVSGHAYYEQVMIYDRNEYPVCIMHIDCFSDMWCPDGYSVYERLNNGETVWVEFTVRALED